MNQQLFPWRSLKTRVTLITLVIFLSGIWALAYYASRMLREDIQQQIGEQQFATVSFLAADINRELKDRFASLKSNADRLAPDMRGNAAALQAALARARILQGLFNGGTMILNLQGTVIAEFPLAPGRKNAGPGGHEFGIGALKENKATIGKPFLAGPGNTPTVPMAVPILDAAGTVTGALVGLIRLDASGFLDPITRNSYGKTGQYIVNSPQYRLSITASNANQVMQPLPKPGVNLLLDRFVNGYEGYGITTDSEGTLILSAAKAIPLAGWFIAIVLPAKEAFAIVDDMQARMLITALILTLIVGCMTWWLMRRQLAPLTEAVKILGNRSDGDQPLRALQIDHNDEVGELFGSFNRLLATLTNREAELKMSEERFRNIVQNSEEAIFIRNAKGEALYVSPQCERVTGRPVEMLLGKKRPEEIHPEDRLRVDEAWDKVARTGIGYRDLEFRLPMPDGSYRWVSGSAGSIALPDGTRGWQSNLRDISKRKRAELLLQTRLRLSELSRTGSTDEVLQAALDSAEAFTESQIGFFHFVDPDQENLSLQVWSTKTRSGMCSADGASQHYAINEAGVWVDAFHSREPVIHNDYASLPHRKGLPEGHARVIRELVVPIIRQGKVTEILGVGNKASDYDQTDVDAVQMIAGMVQDLVERQRVELALGESERRFRELMENIELLAVMLDADGMVTFANEYLLRLTGWNRDDVIGHNWFDLFVAPNAQARRVFYEAVRQGEIPLHYENEILMRSGERRSIAWNNTMLRDQSGTVEGTASIGEDITERRRLEEVHLQAQKLESLGTLAGGIAHDFNNILAAIRGNADLAADDVGPDHPAAESLKEITKASARAGELVRRIMTFGRPKEIKHEVADLAAVLREVLKLLRSTTPTGISFMTEIAKNAPHALADAGQIHEVIVNLTTNAAHAIGPRAGSIEYRLEPVLLEEKMAHNIPGLNPGCYARLTVTDSGCGMSASTLEHIFDAFFTTKPIGEGTGLGLSMVYGIMKNHGGAVTVKSAPGKGSSFALYFPAAENQLVNAESGAPATHMPGIRLKVMYVDDEEALVFLGKRVLSRLGHEFTGFTDPKAALAAFRVSPREFDIVVTDLSMPYMSGFEFAREVLAARPDVPVLMTSGYAHEEDVSAARAIGIRELILKPISAEELSRILERLFNSGGADQGPQI